jgi:hypothetical protein
MKAIEEKFFEKDGEKFRIQVHHCEGAENPLEDECAMGKIYSLGRRHSNHDEAAVRDALDNNPDVVPLGYYEHGLCRWFVSGHAPPGADCPWDGVPFAGVWVPDKEVLEEAAELRGKERKAFMAQRASQVCETYTQWCNGEIYSFLVEKQSTCDQGHHHYEHVDSCGGMYGMDYCWESAKEALGEGAEEAEEFTVDED